MKKEKRCGYQGRIMHINLSTGECKEEQPNDSFYRKYVGGRLLGLYYLLKQRAGTNPYDPESFLIFATSPTVGAPFPGNARHSVVAKSPLTGGFGESEAGGFWGPELKKAGFDALVVTGAAPELAYLLVEDGRVKILDGRFLKGKTTEETREALQAIHGKAQVLCIGPAGENLVRYAAISAGPHDFNGRTGLGAIMGSKKLKAIVVKGTGEVPVYDPQRVRELARWFTENFLADPTNRLLHEAGTAGAVEVYNQLGSLPAFNFRAGTISDAENLSGYVWKEKGLVAKSWSCFACPVACRKEARFTSPFEAGKEVVGHSAEYESLAALGSNCGITDGPSVLALTNLCDQLGLDTISTGVVVSFLMECMERGLLSDKKWSELHSLRLSFGNSQSVYELIKKIAKREGIGNLAAEGVKRLALEVGPDSLSFAMQVKGLEMALQEPRGLKIGAALGYAVAPQGADHIQMEHDYLFETESKQLKSMEPLGVLNPVPAMDLGPEKIRLFVLNQIMWSLYNVFDICIFVAPPGHTYNLYHIKELIGAVTGWNTSWVELMDIGKRALTAARWFNLREGFSAADDWLPRRLFEPLQQGRCAGNAVSPEQLHEALKLYYSFMGWDEEGRPTEGTLKYLGIEWIAREDE